MSAKGYVVRGRWRGQRDVYAYWWELIGDVQWVSERDCVPHDGRLLFASVGDAVNAVSKSSHLTDVRIFEVAEDGTESPLPTYEETLSKIADIRLLREAMIDVMRDLPKKRLEKLLPSWNETFPFAPISPALLDERYYNHLATNPYRSDGEEARMREIAVALRIAGIVDIPEPVPRTPDLGQTSAEIEWLRAEVSRRQTSEAACVRAGLDIVGQLRAELAQTQETLRTAMDDTFRLNAEVARLRLQKAASHEAWARYVTAAIEDRDAQFAEEQEMAGAEEWRARTQKNLAIATAALRDLGVDVNTLLNAKTRTT